MKLVLDMTITRICQNENLAKADFLTLSLPLVYEISACRCVMSILPSHHTTGIVDF
jgi:hypothetical protein